MGLLKLYIHGRPLRQKRKQAESGTKPRQCFSHLILRQFRKMPQLCYARAHSYFPVEADHPPAPLRGFRTKWHRGQDRLFFQCAFDPAFLLASPDCVTFVFFFLTAGDRDSEFQFSPAIIH